MPYLQITDFAENVCLWKALLSIVPDHRFLWILWMSVTWTSVVTEESFISLVPVRWRFRSRWCGSASRNGSHSSTRSKKSGNGNGLDRENDFRRSKSWWWRRIIVVKVVELSWRPCTLARCKPRPCLHHRPIYLYTYRSVVYIGDVCIVMLCFVHRYRKAKIDCLSLFMCPLLAQLKIGFFSSFSAAAVYSTNKQTRQALSSL